MFIHDEENKRLKDELWQLSQAIIRAEPSLMYDGRFEEMVVAPVTIIDIARQLIEMIPQLKQ